MERKTLILIDGHALAFRQFFALERTGMKTTDKQPTWAVYGFFKAVFDLLRNEDIKPDCIAVAFDVGRQTFRVERYAEYKANRETMPDTLRSQMELIFEGLKAFNIPIYTKESYEADDVIGTICDKATKLGHKTLILTGDQDSFQLVDREGFVKVLIPSKGELIEYDWYKVREKLGVWPSQVIDYKALRGDTSDNIPGIKGIGEKTAQKLLSRYKHLDEILEDCKNIPENAVRERICAGKEIAELSYELATIVKDVDINFDFDCTMVDLPDIAKVTEFLKRLQFYGFIRNIDSILAGFTRDKKVLTVKEEVETETEPMQQPLSEGFSPQLSLFSQEVKSQINEQSKADFEQKTVITKEDLQELVNSLKRQTLISIDTETTSLDIKEAELVGIAIAFNENYTAGTRVKINENSDIKTKSFYIPVFHQVGEQLELAEVLSALKPVFEDEKIKKTMQNAKFDYNILRNNGILTKEIIFDTMLASYINDPSRKHGLKTQSLENLGYMMQEIEELIGSGKKQISMENVGIEEASDYATNDAYVTLELTKYWQNKLDEKELDLLYDIETPAALVLADMEWDGVSVDEEYLNELSEEFSIKIQELEENIFDIAGEKFNVNSPKQVGEILFDKLEIAQKKKKRGKSAYSTSADILEELVGEHKICEYLLQHRKYSKLKSTYTDALPLLISRCDNRIHTSYNQTVTMTGRLSSSNPNLQNIPTRSDDGNKIRNAFVPENRENYILSADYSQIELRLLAHVSKDDNLIEAFESGEDIHTLTASKVFEVPIDGVTEDMRRKAKAVNFGIIYGQSKYGLAKSLSIAPFAAEMFIEKYFASYPKIREYMNNTIQFAHENGYVETIYGRKRYLLNELASPNHQIKEFAQRAAINQPLQGAAADLIKMAMVKLKELLSENNLKSKLIMQVHDELILEVESEELEQVKKLVQEAMELNQPFLVPLVLDMYYEHKWG